MSNFTKGLLAAASGIPTGDGYRADANDPNSQLWVIGNLYFLNGSATDSNMISAQSAESIYFSALDAQNDLHVFNISSDGTLSSNKLEISGHDNGSGAFIDPYDTSSIYISGNYVDGAFDQVQICKLDADLDNTTPIWNKQTNFTANVGNITGAPMITENYIWQSVLTATSAGDGTNNNDTYIVKLDKDGTKQSVLKLAINTGEFVSGSSNYYDVSLDETRLAFMDKDNADEVHLVSYDLTNNSRVFHIKINTANESTRDLAIDNSDNGVVVTTYDSTYIYIQKYSSSGSFVWKKRIGPASGDNRILGPVISIKPDGSEGILKVNNTKTSDGEYFALTFDPSDGTLSSNCTRVTGSDNNITSDQAAPLIIGDRAYVSAYIYNTNGGTTFESFVMKLDTDFADSATFSGFFQNQMVITGGLTTTSELSISTLSDISTSVNSATISTVTSSLFFETAGPSNISSSTLTPTKYEWRS